MIENIWFLSTYPPEEWNKLQSKSKVDLVTSSKCINLLTKHHHQADFSSGIVPLMKALETELKMHFYIPFMDFLQRNYSVEQFVNIANPGNRTDEELARMYDKILYLNGNKELSYRHMNMQSYFTLKDYLHCVGIIDQKKLAFQSNF